MSELAERSGVSAGTIRYYLREGLLGDGRGRPCAPAATWPGTPPRYVERIALIKRLQEERFLPLRVIRGALDQSPERVGALIELPGPDPRALARERCRGGAHLPPASPHARYGVPVNVLGRLEEIDVLSPGRGGYRADDVQIIEAIASFRAGGYDRGAGLHRLRHAALPRGARTARRGGGRGRCSSGSPARSTWSARWEIVQAGTDPLRELIGAMHSKLLIAALRRAGAARAGAGIVSNRPHVWRPEGERCTSRPSS